MIFIINKAFKFSPRIIEIFIESIFKIKRDKNILNMTKIIFQYVLCNYFWSVKYKTQNL